MTDFTVHERPDPPADRLSRAERLVFVRDGFAWGPALLGPLWLAMQRNWPMLGLWAVAAVILAAAVRLVGADPGWTGLAFAALGVVVGFEAADLRRERFAAEGWHELGSASGRDQTDAERDFFDRWLADAGTTGRQPAPGAKDH